VRRGSPNSACPNSAAAQLIESDMRGRRRPNREIQPELRSNLSTRRPSLTRARSRRWRRFIEEVADGSRDGRSGSHWRAASAQRTCAHAIQRSQHDDPIRVGHASQGDPAYRRRPRSRDAADDILRRRQGRRRYRARHRNVARLHLGGGRRRSTCRAAASSGSATSTRRPSSDSSPDAPTAASSRPRKCCGTLRASGS
jgi:hypothetical protein